MKALKLLSTLISVAALGLVYSESAKAALTINSQSVVTDFDTQSVLFTIDFNRVPDFFTVDSFGRQADDFQYFIDVDGEIPVLEVPDQLEIIIRGGEINIAGDLRIRNSDPSDSSDPNSGGWGSIRGSVPFSLEGTLLKFSVPFQLLGDSDGVFSYNLQVDEFGEFTDFLPDQLVSVPEPFSIPGILALGVLGVGSAFQRFQKKSAEN